MRYDKDIFEQDCEQAYYSALRESKKKVNNDEFIGYVMINDHLINSYRYQADFLSGYSREKKEADQILWKWNERLNSELDDYKEEHEEKRAEKEKQERERQARREQEERERVRTKTTVSVSTSLEVKKIDWSGLIDKNGHATIPQGVRKIDNNAFFNCSGLRSVHIPDTVTEIGEMAFFLCGLENIVIPDSVTRIGKNAFALCQDLESVDIPDSVIEIGDGAFKAFSLRKIRTNKPELLKNAVDEGPKICSLNGADSDVEIDWDDLIDDDDHAIIPDGVTEIDEGAFMESSLTGVQIPNSVTRIGGQAFLGCSLESVDIPNSVTEICYRAFSACALQKIIVPNGVVEVGDEAFSFCYDLTEVVIPDSVQVFGKDVFEECDALEVVYTNKPEMLKGKVGENVKILPLKDYENKPSTVEEKTIVCPNCGTNIGSTAKFCLECGTPLQVVCPKCNSVQKAGFKFCMNCGNQF